jgi:glycosyltransferase involved in cell wall biosynthesis
LFISGQFPNPIHGGGGRVADFIKLMGCDHDIYLYAWSIAELDAQAVRDLAPYCKAIQTVDPFTFECSVEQIKKFIGQVPIDIVHYEWPRSLSNFDITLGTKHVFTFMECVSLRLVMDLRLGQTLTPVWLKKFLELIRALKIELVDASRAHIQLVVTQKDGAFLARLAPQNSYVILNHGVNFQEFCLPDSEPEANTLVFVGHFQHYPNEDAARFFFDEIFDLIVTACPSVKIYIVGANPSWQVLRYHDGKHVIVTNTVDDIRPYIQRATVCVAPLVTGAGLRSKVIQYAALKRPCVATTVAATDLTFEDGKEIFIADQPSEFAKRVISLLEDPMLARNMGERAFKKASFDYDNRRLVSALYQVYNEMDQLIDHPNRLKQLE